MGLSNRGDSTDQVETDYYIYCVETDEEDFVRTFIRACKEECQGEDVYKCSADQQDAAQYILGRELHHAS